MYLEIPPEVYGSDMYSSNRPRPAGTGVSPRVAWDSNDSGSHPLPYVRSSSSLSKASMESSKNQWNDLKRSAKHAPRSGRPSVSRRPSSRVSVASSNGALGPWNTSRSQNNGDRRAQTPGSLNLDGTETPRKEGSRRTSLLATKPAKPQSAWEMFEEHIKEIDDSTPYFARNQRKFRSSDAFRQVLNDLDFSQPNANSNERHNSDDLDPMIKVSADGLDPESQVLGSEFGDITTDRSSPNTSVIEDVWEDPSLSRSSVGFRTPVPMSILEDIVGEAEEEKKTDAQYIAVKDMTSDPDQARNALYQRYLARPDTWANGLKKYLTKTTTRERVSSSSSLHTGTVGFRPKSTSQYIRNPAEVSQYNYAARGRAVSAYHDAAVGLNKVPHKKRAKSAGIQLSKKY